MNARTIIRFLQLESASGIILFMMAAIAMVWANTFFSAYYQEFVNRSLFWVNDGLMAIFFLIVGLELKREFLHGQLSRLSQVALPLVAALGGMLVPAVLYYLINYTDPVMAKGWATPVATDIAFALGVLSLFGQRVPVTLKLFLLALAIFDDLGAIIIISIFHADGLSLIGLELSCMLVTTLILFNWLSVRQLVPYLVIGAWLWLSLLNAGIHPTLAGVLLALTIPDDHRHSPLRRLENSLHPWVAFFILPLFALCNAGFSLQGMSLTTLTNGIVLGIIVGLFVGKQIGVFGFSWILIRLGLAKLPESVSWLELYGVAVLCGIGFTMSLFLGTLSFQNESIYLTDVRLGVI